MNINLDFAQGAAVRGHFDFKISNFRSIDFLTILPIHREELREAMVNFGTRCTDE